MGNHPARGTISPSAMRQSTMSPIHESGRNSRGFSFNTNRNSRTSTVYNEILRDGEKLRNRDHKNHYNQHRRVESIASNLPNQLESYSNAIFIVNEFWLNHIEKLSESELNQLVMVLWAHLFLKFKSRRDVLILAQKGNMGSHARKILTVFGYVIRNIIHPSNHLKLFKQLQALGAVHRGYSLSNEIFTALLTSFNYAMEERFSNEYKVRTRFCFSQIYQVIVDIMTGEDFYTFTMSRLSSQSMLPSMTMSLNDNDTSSTPKLDDDDIDDDELDELNGDNDSNRSSQLQTLYHQIDGFLGSLEECLSDDVGSLYFKKYLEEQFCAENFLFHESVLKYKSANGKHRIKCGEQIIHEFVAIGSAKEVNLSYNTRKQILSIVKLVQKLNANKDKYQQLLTVKRADRASIMNEDDIRCLKHQEPISGHYRMPTTKKVGLELAEITSDIDENIEDVIYSMGFTDSLFDIAYDEIFHLMKINSWNKFRNAILEYCGDDEFRKLQKKKLEQKKKEQKQTVNMVQVINSIARSHRRYTQTDDYYNEEMPQKIEMKKQQSIHDLLNRRKTTEDSNHIAIKKKKERRRSKDDFDIDGDFGYNKKASFKVRQYRSRNINLNESISFNKEETIKDLSPIVTTTPIDHSTVIKEDLEYTIHRNAFKARNKPRLSFIPTIMPSIEKSETSPTVKFTNYQLRKKSEPSGVTPGGGACVEVAAHVDNNDGKYSPSQLFSLISTTFPWEYTNKSDEKKKEIKRNKKRISGIYKSSNGELPLYVTHKKRKSKLAKRKSIKLKKANKTKSV